MILPTPGRRALQDPAFSDAGTDPSTVGAFRRTDCSTDAAGPRAARGPSRRATGRSPPSPPTSTHRGQVRRSDRDRAGGSGKQRAALGAASSPSLGATVSGFPREHAHQPFLRRELWRARHRAPTRHGQLVSRTSPALGCASSTSPTRRAGSRSLCSLRNDDFFAPIPSASS